MAVEDIVNYIEENKDEHSVQDLVGEIRKSGYPDSEILGAIEILKQRRVSGADISTTKVKNTNNQSVSELSTGQKVLATIGGFLLLPSLLLLFMLLESSYFFYYIFSIFGSEYRGILSYLLLPIIALITVFWFFNKRTTLNRYSKPIRNGVLIFLALGLLYIITILYLFGIDF
ncbi:MAG: hypothetical protein AAB965_03335 [Patescibacteria group bacterium]